MNIKKQKILNNFATCCFRDVADQDYIAARLLFRNGLYHQFLWQSQQALEKYFKGIYLFNRVPAKEVGHDLRLAYKKTNELPFFFSVDNHTVDFIEYINDFGQGRYLESSHFISGPVLNQLDNAIWNIRRYCQPLNASIPFSDDYVIIIEKRLTDIKESERLKDTVFYRIKNGKLESIIDSKANKCRDALIWQNLFFGKIKRRKVFHPDVFMAQNSPLFNHPEIIDDVLYYVRVPKKLANEYRKRIRS